MTIRHLATVLTVALLAVTSSATYEPNSHGTQSRVDRSAESKATLETIGQLAGKCIRTYQIVSDYWGWGSDADTCNPRSSGHVRAAVFVRGLVDRLDDLEHHDPSWTVLRRCMDDMLGPMPPCATYSRAGTTAAF